MGLKENIFGATTTVNRNQRDHSQEQDALSDISGLLGNMALGSDPGDDALFRNRLLQGKGYQLANRGTRSRLDSADAMATLPEYGAQNALSMGIDTSKMSPEDLLKFAAQMAYSDKQNALAMSHRNTSGSIDDQRQNAQNLTNSQSLSDVILQNKVLEGDNLVQSGFNLEDAATNASALNDANVNLNISINTNGKRCLNVYRFWLVNTFGKHVYQIVFMFNTVYQIVFMFMSKSC